MLIIARARTNVEFVVCLRSLLLVLETEGLRIGLLPT